MAPRPYSLPSTLRVGLCLPSASPAIRSSCLSCAAWRPVFPPNLMSILWWTIYDPQASQGAHLAAQRPRLHMRRFRAALQLQTATFCLDSDSGFHSRKNRPALFTYLPDSTLELCAGAEVSFNLESHLD